MRKLFTTSNFETTVDDDAVNGCCVTGYAPAELSCIAPATLSIELSKSGRSVQFGKAVQRQSLVPSPLHCCRIPLLVAGYSRLVTRRGLISHDENFFKEKFTSFARKGFSVLVSRLTLFVLVLSILIIATPLDAGANPLGGLRFMGLTRIQAEGKFRVNTFHCNRFFCWGPNLTNNSDGLGPEFYTVVIDSGFVEGYSQRLRSGSDYNQALNQLRFGLPVDVKFHENWLETSNGNRCEFVNATSRDLALVMGNHDPKGVIGIELSSGVDSNLQMLYSAVNIEDATLSLVAIARGTGC
jgi:hypothetical protein